MRGMEMLQDKSKIESARKRWDEHAKRYDAWYKTFEGAVEHYVDWELLKGYLPKNREAKILDAAGGTGRITLPLAKMGYSVTLCDISPEMLKVARQKLLREEVLDNVEIVQCDVCKLRFADESFDFVLCWDGMIEAAKEVIRVTKKAGGRISVFLMNRCGAAIDKFHQDADSALALLRSESDYIYDDGEKYTVIDVKEAKRFFEKEGIKVIAINAVCGLLDLLSVPEKVRRSRDWDEKSFRQVTEMLLRLSQEPSVKGLSRHLVLYGERI
jgi:ubiquinone/menaquinone biosynthesis C-methylase UbiE